MEGFFDLSVSPARRAPHPNQATIGFTTLSVPLTGDRNPSRKGKDVTALSAVFLKSSRPSLPLKKAPPLISVFSPQGRRGKPPSGARNRFALRLAGHQNPRQVMRDGTAGEIAVYSLQLIVYSLRLISWLFADNLQISC